MDAVVPEVTGAQLLSRALRLLFTLRERDRPVSASELSQALEIAPSNVYRLVQTLELSGLVERRERGQIQLGLRFLDLGRALEDRIETEVVPSALPVMRTLTEAIDETTLLTMPAGLRAICVLSVESSRPIRLSYSTGRVLPLHGGASGKVLLPWLPRRVLEDVIRAAEGFELASGERLTAKQLVEQVEEIRSRGFCLTRGEVDAEATGLAAPVMAQDRLFAGLTAAGPTSRFGEERLPQLVDQVRAAAAEIGRRLDDRRVLDG